MRGFCGIFCCWFWFLGILFLPLGDALTISMISPAIAILLAFIFLREKITKIQLSCILVGFLGIIFIAKPPMIFSMFTEVE